MTDSPAPDPPADLSPVAGATSSGPRTSLWRRLLYTGLVAAMVIVTYFLATLVQVWAAAGDDERRPVDAIVVMGAAQFDGRPSPVFAARLDHALELWSEGYADLIVTTGSNQAGDRFTEGFSGYVYLLERGVPDRALIPIVDGGDTWEQLSATAAQMRARLRRTILVVSDRYHSHRVREIAGELGLDAYVSPTDVDPTLRDYLREATAVSIGRVLGYRRVSAWDPPG